MAQITAIKPAILKKGDRVGLICPASRPYKRSTVANCVALVEDMGFVPVLGKSIFNVSGYLAGSDQERLSDLHTFFGDRSIAAIFSITGGYGALRLLELLDYDLILKNPKLLIGAEDASSLLLAIYHKTGLVSCYGPSLDAIDSLPCLQAFQSAVSTFREDFVWRPLKPGWLQNNALLRTGSGVHTGTVIGANLNVLISLLGTPYIPDLSDSLLCLDDLDERNDGLDRWFTGLYVSGILKSVAALAFGTFQGCDPRNDANVFSWEDLFYERLIELKKASCFGFGFGDSVNAEPLPIGIQGTLSVDEGTLILNESMFAK
jgi:muramoyltetrapeptide carboxypeptidase